MRGDHCLFSVSSFACISWPGGRALPLHTLAAEAQGGEGVRRTPREWRRAGFWFLARLGAKVAGSFPGVSRAVGLFGKLRHSACRSGTPGTCPVAIGKAFDHLK